MLNDMTSYKLAKVSNGLSLRTARIYFAEFGLKLLDWRIIVALQHEGPRSVQQVAILIEADKGNVSRSAAELEKAGLVTRSAEALGRRKIVLTLTRAGRAVFARINPIARARESRLLSTLDAKERAQLDRTLEKLIDWLAVMDAETEMEDSPQTGGAIRCADQ
jgi:DNA-binding MarR family transcriptional regulator